jgi:uncharacterized protein
MQSARVFLDTSYVVATFDVRDTLHAKARALRPTLETAEVLTTEAVLIEIANALSRWNRMGASWFIESCYQTPSIHVVSIDSALMKRGLALYTSRGDKTWGLTDCISFVVMGEHDVAEALTADKHFVQAGFRALMLEEA